MKKDYILVRGEKDEHTGILFLMERADLESSNKIIPGSYVFVSECVVDRKDKKVMPNGYKAFLLRDSDDKRYRVYPDYSVTPEK